MGRSGKLIEEVLRNAYGLTEARLSRTTHEHSHIVHSDLPYRPIDVLSRSLLESHKGLARHPLGQLCLSEIESRLCTERTGVSGSSGKWPKCFFHQTLLIVSDTKCISIGRRDTIPYLFAVVGKIVDGFVRIAQTVVSIACHTQELRSLSHGRIARQESVGYFDRFAVVASQQLDFRDISIGFIRKLRAILQSRKSLFGFVDSAILYLDSSKEETSTSAQLTSALGSLQQHLLGQSIALAQLHTHVCIIKQVCSQVFIVERAIVDVGENGIGTQILFMPDHQLPCEESHTGFVYRFGEIVQEIAYRAEDVIVIRSQQIVRDDTIIIHLQSVLLPSVQAIETELV